VVDDNRTLTRSLEVFLSGEGYEVLTAQSGAEAIRKAADGSPDLGLIDLKLPDLDGVEVLRRLKETDKDLTAFIITAYGQIESAVEAMRAGAYDYLTKPLNLSELGIAVEKALSALSLKKQLLRETHELDYHLIGESLAMRQIRDLVAKVADGGATTILILGETGTGKGLLARNIHLRGSRRDRPFVAVNCSAIPEGLIESELFGYEKGAFTDAKRLKKGLLEASEKGTLFLDEIGELKTPIQVKLLNVIEEKTFRRLGGTKDVSVDVRIIASTNRDLEAAVASGDFRSDLYYRLKVLSITIPPLRDRREDIPLLADYFLKKYGHELGKDIKFLSPDAMEALLNYRWPGNVRELRNTIERIYLLRDEETILPDHLSLPAEAANAKPSTSDGGRSNHLVGRPMSEIEKFYIEETLKRTGGRKTEAAKMLGISLNTLKRKLRV